jgi:uncharacterized membrane protein YeaQ/YmgE (transglycosylase-associated protein family)
MTGLFWFILIGVAAGFLAGQVMKGKGFGFLGNLIVGIGGAILGGWLFDVLNLHFAEGLKGSLITAFVGAVVLLFIINLLQKK